MDHGYKYPEFIAKSDKDLLDEAELTGNKLAQELAYHLMRLNDYVKNMHEGS